jgi:hypothetical protein
MVRLEECNRYLVLLPKQKACPLSRAHGIFFQQALPGKKNESKNPVENFIGPRHSIKSVAREKVAAGAIYSHSDRDR